MAKRRTPTLENGMELWPCGNCKGMFARSEFYTCKRSPSGMKSECKKCHNITSIASRNKDTHREKNKQWMRKSSYHQRPGVIGRTRNFSRVKNKSIEAKARNLANRAVDLGFLIRPEVCPSCGNIGKVHAHHSDYSQPLAVEWLCSDCHGVRHRFARDEMERQRMEQNLIRIEQKKKYINHDLIEKLEVALEKAKSGEQIAGAYVAINADGALASFYSIEQMSPYPERTCLIGACNELVMRLLEVK